MSVSRFDLRKSIVNFAFGSLFIFLVLLGYLLFPLTKFSHFGFKDDRWSNDNRSASTTEQMYVIIGGLKYGVVWCACVHKTAARNNRAHTKRVVNSMYRIIHNKSSVSLTVMCKKKDRGTIRYSLKLKSMICVNTTTSSVFYIVCHLINGMSCK